MSILARVLSDGECPIKTSAVLCRLQPGWCRLRLMLSLSDLHTVVERARVGEVDGARVAVVGADRPRIFPRWVD